MNQNKLLSTTVSIEGNCLHQPAKKFLVQWPEDSVICSQTSGFLLSFACWWAGEDA